MIRTVAIGALVAFAASALPAVACETISSKEVQISACIDTTGWLAQTANEDQDHLYFSEDGNIGFAMVGEQGVNSVASFRSAILDNAKTGGGEVKILAERVETVDGKPWNVLEFQTTSDGTTFYFADFYYLAPGFGAAQMVYWTLPEMSTIAAFRAGQMLATVSMGGN